MGTKNRVKGEERDVDKDNDRYVPQISQYIKNNHLQKLRKKDKTNFK